MEKDQYYIVNREYVHKAIEHFTVVFKFYVVETLKREYGDEFLAVVINGPGKDKAMSTNKGEIIFNIYSK